MTRLEFATLLPDPNHSEAVIPAASGPERRNIAQGLRHHAELLKTNTWLFARVAAVAIVVAAALAIYQLNVAPVYLASAKVTVQPSEAELRFTRVISGVTEDGSAGVVTHAHMEYLRSHAAAERVVAELTERYGEASVAAPAKTGLQRVVSNAGQLVAASFRWMNSGTFTAAGDPDTVAARIRNATSLGMIEDSFILEIAVRWDDPQVAADIANILAGLYQARSRGETESATEELTAFLMQRRAEAEATIAALRLRRNEFRTLNGIVDFGRERSDLLSRISAEQAALDADRADLRATRALIAAADSSGGALSDGAAERLERERLDEIALAEEVAGRSATLARLEAQLARYASFEDQIVSLDDALARERARLEEIDARLLTAGMGGTERIDALRLIEEARPPLYPETPKVLRAAGIGLAAGLALTLLFVVLRDRLDPRVRTALDLRRATGLRVVAPVKLARRGPGRALGPLLGWPALDGSTPVLVLDTCSEDRAEAVVRCLMARSATAVTFDIGLVRHALRPGYIPDDTGAVLVTLARGEIAADDLAASLAPLQRVTALPIAVSFVEGATPAPGTEPTRGTVPQGA